MSRIEGLLSDHVDYYNDTLLVWFNFSLLRLQPFCWCSEVKEVDHVISPGHKSFEWVADCLRDFAEIPLSKSVKFLPLCSFIIALGWLISNVHFSSWKAEESLSPSCTSLNIL